MSAPLLPEDGPQRSQSWRQFEDEARRLRPAAPPSATAAGVRAQAWFGEAAATPPEPPAPQPAATAAFCGLALSGGGIRSATFALGVLQAMAEARLLRRVDYLSTVSGGGYIGTWLSALIHRTDADSRRAVRQLEQPGPVGIAPSVAAAGQPGGCRDDASQTATGASEHPAIAFLRRYSNYLTPRFGLFSVDTLAAVANLSRNLLLTQSVFILFLLGLLFLPRGVVLALWQGGPPSPWLWGAVLLLLAVAARGLYRGMTWYRRPAAAGDGSSRPGPSQGQVLRGAVLPGMLAALLAAALFNDGTWLPALAGGDGALWAALVLAYPLLWLLAAGLDLPLPRGGGTAFRVSLAAALPAGALLAVLVYGYVRLLAALPPPSRPWLAVGLGAFVLWEFLCLAVALHIGLMKRALAELAREWAGRAGGMSIGIGLGWSLVALVSFYGSAFLGWLGQTLAAAGGLAWLISTVAGALAGRSPATGGKGANPWLERLLQAAPYIFIGGLLLLLSWLGEWGLRTLAGAGEQPWFLAPSLTMPGLAAVVLAASVCLLGAWALSARIDVNLFSMHQFYRNRLTRCYLGASNPQRRSDRFTDFDPADDLPLQDLAAQRPIPLLNGALNLTGSEPLEWQQRQAAPFIFSPDRCGFLLPPSSQSPEWREFLAPSRDYMSREGAHLGMAMAVSGAAANPNMGYHTEPAMAFVMALLNVRLGRWCPNPAGPFTALSSPPLGLWYLLRELFGSVNEDTGFVNVSDGGHFENLGLYELVRRRCRLIVVSDGGQDRDFQFEDLGNAIRKCRVDLGAEIDIDVRPLLPGAAPRQRLAVGRIRYWDDGRQALAGMPPTPECGVLVYLKPMVLGDESVDVGNYAATHPDFPHQSTADQWFDEAQFESYRQLGLATGRRVFGQGPWRQDEAADDEAWVRAVAAALAMSAAATP